MTAVAIFFSLKTDSWRYKHLFQCEKQFHLLIFSPFSVTFFASAYPCLPKKTTHLVFVHSTSRLSSKLQCPVVVIQPPAYVSSSFLCTPTMFPLPSARNSCCPPHVCYPDCHRPERLVPFFLLATKISVQLLKLLKPLAPPAAVFSPSGYHKLGGICALGRPCVWPASCRPRPWRSACVS